MHYQFDIKMDRYVMMMRWWLWWDGGDDDDGGGGRDDDDDDDDGCDDNDGDGPDNNDYKHDDGNGQVCVQAALSLYHDSIIVSCLSYSENTFSHRLISYLDGLSYPVDDDKAS